MACMATTRDTASPRSSLDDGPAGHLEPLSQVLLCQAGLLAGIADGPAQRGSIHGTVERGWLVMFHISIITPNRPFVLYFKHSRLMGMFDISDIASRLLRLLAARIPRTNTMGRATKVRGTDHGRLDQQCRRNPSKRE